MSQKSGALLSFPPFLKRAAKPRSISDVLLSDWRVRQFFTDQELDEFGELLGGDVPSAAFDEPELCFDVLADSAPQSVLIPLNGRHELHIQFAEIFDIAGEVGVSADAVRRVSACLLFRLAANMNVDLALVVSADGDGNAPG